MLGLDGEREVGGAVAFGLHAHADLRRGELLHAHGAATVDAGVLRVARRGDIDLPASAGQFGGNCERIAPRGTIGVRDYGLALHHLAVGIAQQELYGERLGSLIRAIAKNGVHENLFVVAVDAAFGPDEGRDNVRTQVFLALALSELLFYVLTVLKANERSVLAVCGLGDHGERLGTR